jgi:SAM-dependent methyltransferase
VTLRLIARQLSRPTGFLGVLVARVMNRMNAPMNAAAVSLLSLEPSDRVLEIGFGGGVTLPALIAGAAFVGGVDRSPDVIVRAKARFAREVQSGLADFREGTVEAIPFADLSFEKVCTVNTVYFWRSLDSGLAEIARVLVPGGRLVVGYVPREAMDRMNMPADIFTPRSPEEIAEALERAGFRIRGAGSSTPFDRVAWSVIAATRA